MTAATQERSVTVERRPARMDHGYIPEEVVQYFAGKGKHVRLNHDSEQGVLQLASLQAYPVMESELSEEVLDALKRAAFKVRPDGSIGRMDTLLFVQDEGIRGLIEQEAREEFARKMGSSIAEVDQANEQMQRAGLGHIEKRRVPKIGEHIYKGE